MSTTYTIEIKHHNFSISDFYISKSFPLADHKSALDYVISNLSETMVIEVMKKVTSTAGWTTEYSPVTSTDLPKYVQAKVKGLVVFAEHIGHVQLAMKETEACVIFVTEKEHFLGEVRWNDLNECYEFNHHVCSVITQYCKEYGHKKLQFQVLPAYTDEQIDTHIQKRTLDPVCWGGTLAPWHYAELKEQEELAALKAELNNPSEPKALSPEDQADYDRQIAEERTDGCMDDPQDKIESEMKASVQVHSETEKTVPSFGPDQEEEFVQFETQKSERAGKCFNISGDEWSDHVYWYGIHCDDHYLIPCEYTFQEFLKGHKHLAPFIEVAEMYALTVEELVDIKEQFMWFCEDFKYNVRNKSLFHSYIQHWKTVNHTSNTSNI
jgi:hypothetical protein